LFLFLFKNLCLAHSNKILYFIKDILKEIDELENKTIVDNITIFNFHHLGSKLDY